MTWQETASSYDANVTSTHTTSGGAPGHVWAEFWMLGCTGLTTTHGPAAECQWGCTAAEQSVASLRCPITRDDFDSQIIQVCCLKHFSEIPTLTLILSSGSSTAPPTALKRTVTAPKSNVITIMNKCAVVTWCLRPCSLLNSSCFAAPHGDTPRDTDVRCTPAACTHLEIHISCAV